MLIAEGASKSSSVLGWTSVGTVDCCFLPNIDKVSGVRCQVSGLIFCNLKPVTRNLFLQVLLLVFFGELVSFWPRKER